ncbi:hypothetical protein JW905_14380 [bacterium]|nr:hypothetical protein [candidate division CSSED10-310 bacterium]
MIRCINRELWAIDAEWAPDVATGRRVYGLGEEMADEDVLARMFQEGGATEEDPQPYLKTVLCRVISVAALVRKVAGTGVTHQLVALPRFGDGPMPEKELLQRFLDGMGKSEPQLVGYNLFNADLPILVQRAAACGVVAPEFCRRPNKPWEGRDYFARGSDWVVDLQLIYGGWGRAVPSLHQLACAARVPGKIDTDGAGVVDLWRAGEMSRIVAYNECDALTTFLVWLKTVRFCGQLPADQADDEEVRLRSYVETLVDEGHGHLRDFIVKWDALRGEGRVSIGGA